MLCRLLLCLFLLLLLTVLSAAESFSPHGQTETVRRTTTRRGTLAVACWSDDKDDDQHAAVLLPSCARGGDNKSSSSSKLANFRQRAIPAAALLAGLYLLVDRYQEKGLTVLLLLLSPGLYYEATSVLDSHHATPTGLDLFTNKWWWFLTYSLASTIPRALHMFDHDEYQHGCHLVSYAMVLIGFMAWILRLNTVTATAASNHFMTAWTELGLYHMGVVFTLVPVTFWIAVLTEFRQAWALYTAILVILNDTFAYLFGFSIGKNALLATISPKKTWEGWLGALVSTVLLSPVAWKLFFDDGYNQHSFVVALFCCIGAPFGGFLASSIKRAAGKKDFGNLIAGHGGLVDRLDCQLLAAPFLYLYLKAAKL